VSAVRLVAYWRWLLCFGRRFVAGVCRPYYRHCGYPFSTTLTFTNVGSDPATAFLSIHSIATLSVPTGSGIASSAETLAIVGTIPRPLFSFSSSISGGLPVTVPFGGTFFFPLAVGDSITLSDVGMTHADATALDGSFFSKSVVDIVDNRTFGITGSTGAVTLTISGSSSDIVDVIGENPPIQTAMASVTHTSLGILFELLTTDVQKSVTTPYSFSFPIAPGTPVSTSGSLEHVAQAAAVPEPATFMLFGGGMLTIGCLLHVRQAAGRANRC
jgi:hypothetical protein